MQEYIKASWLGATRLKSGDNATRVISPFWRTWYDRLGKINRRHLSLQGAAQCDDLPAICRPICSHHAVKLDSHRQDKAVVVIGVLANDVNPARGGSNPARRTAVDFFKFSGDMGC